jgi:hypothetical protein
MGDHQPGGRLAADGARLGLGLGLAAASRAGRGRRRRLGGNGSGELLPGGRAWRFRFRDAPEVTNRPGKLRFRDAPEVTILCSAGGDELRQLLLADPGDQGCLHRSPESHGRAVNAEALSAATLTLCRAHRPVEEGAAHFTSHFEMWLRSR